MSSYSQEREDGIFDLQMQLFPLSTKATKQYTYDMAEHFVKSYFGKTGYCNEAMMMIVSECYKQGSAYSKAEAVLKSYIK